MQVNNSGIVADIVLKKSKIDQFEQGVFANRDFKKGEVVIRYNLKQLTQKEFDVLAESEKQFTHVHWSRIFLYPVPARYVNHSDKPNTVQNLKEQCDDVALRDIKMEKR